MTRTDEVSGARYVIDTLLTQLASDKMHKLGVSYPVLIKAEKLKSEKIAIPGPKQAATATPGRPAIPGMGGGGYGGPPASKGERDVMVEHFQFRVQFVWQPKWAGEQVAEAVGTAGPPLPPSGAAALRPPRLAPRVLRRQPPLRRRDHRFPAPPRRP